MTTPDRSCPTPQCQGQIADDGYCEICGSAPTPAAPPPTTPPPVDSSSTSGATTSWALAVSAMGSGRAGGRAGNASAAASRTCARTRTPGTRGSHLGAGIVAVAPAPVADAAAAVLARPEVPEHRRFCSRCGGPVGRSRQGRIGRADGFCPFCGEAFAFSPRLSAGDVVAGQYRIKGCLAFGGMGWVYLALDQNVSDRWVVLKGLLNSTDPDAAAAAIAEREFLAAVSHPHIVKIYNFVVHDGCGYIVMEYVGGISLKDVLVARRRANRGAPDPLPTAQAVAYLIEVLSALGHLHEQGMLYCDLKPDNVMHVGDGIKLIDLGGVRHLADLDSPIYGTVGYQAPEVSDVGPSVASDLWTVGRTLLSLAADFRGNTTTYAASLPSPEDLPLLARHDSLHRWLLRACASDPADRFTTCDEARAQLLGVLREVVSRERPDDRPADHSTASAAFGPPLAEGADLTWRGLPVVRLDDGHPQLLEVRHRLGSDPAPEAKVRELAAVPDPDDEVLLSLARTFLDMERPDEAVTVCQRVVEGDPWQWRADWYEAIAALQRQDWGAAVALFNAVLGQVPGELAPKLALAFACEQAGELAVAERLYLICLRTDAHYAVPAAFGLSRVRYARGTQNGPTTSDGLRDAVAALDLVPAASAAYAFSRARRAELLLQHAAEADTLGPLQQALDSITGVLLDPAEGLSLRTRVLEQALTLVRRDARAEATALGGVPLTDRALSLALEKLYRQRVPLTEDADERILLVDRARAVRPWTWR